MALNQNCLYCKKPLASEIVEFFDRKFCSKECIKETPRIRGLSCVICKKPFVEPRDNYGFYSQTKVICSYDCKKALVELNDVFVSSPANQNGNIRFCPCSRGCYV